MPNNLVSQVEILTRLITLVNDAYPGSSYAGPTNQAYYGSQVGARFALGDDDKASIQETIDDEVLMRQGIGFRSTAVQTVADGGRIGVQGELTLVGKTCPSAFDLELDEHGKLRGNAVVKQTDWGITPYSTLFGALKVADEVEVVFDGRLPA